ncbi:toprim domain-containing protein [Rhizobium mongolense]|uniref:toprim domain-containing protein n=1 Tax=Rhizobium mongolense TaxID=57676 RepID=UPI0035561C7C
MWRGFSTGGAKTLFRFGNSAGGRLCVTEGAIDALSLSALEGRRADTLYASTAGGWSPATESAVTLLAGDLDLVVAATDRNSQGEAYADKLRQIASRQGCGFQRLRPIAGDWNEDLQQGREWEEG